MHRGPAGAGALNVLLQEAIAPARDAVPERRQGARVFRPGDKVIQIRNNYDKGAAGVFNDTVGTVTALSVVDRQLRVRTDEDEDIDYEFDELDDGVTSTLVRTPSAAARTGWCSHPTSPAG